MRRVGLIAIVGVLLLCGAPIRTIAGVSITTSDDATLLVDEILGEGIMLVGTPSYTGASAASGFFTGGGVSGIGMDTGIIMTSGDASLAAGSNTGDGTGASNGTPGDADLENLLPSGTTYDATVLEFDFATTGGDVYFNYVFASEEYNEYTNSEFNDIFAFLLDGDNIALIPGTTTPVSVNTVNGGNPFGTDASHPEYFNNNDLDDGGPFWDFEYDGFTDVFTAQALDLTSGTHHIKLAIADTGDSVLDSAVFIETGTFSDTNTIPVPGAIMLASFGVGLVRWGHGRRRRG